MNPIDLPFFISLGSVSPFLLPLHSPLYQQLFLDLYHMPGTIIITSGLRLAFLAYLVYVSQARPTPVNFASWQSQVITSGYWSKPFNTSPVPSVVQNPSGQDPAFSSMIPNHLSCLIPDFQPTALPEGSASLNLLLSLLCLIQVFFLNCFPYLYLLKQKSSYKHLLNHLWFTKLLTFFLKRYNLFPVKVERDFLPLLYVSMWTDSHQVALLCLPRGHIQYVFVELESLWSCRRSLNVECHWRQERFFASLGTLKIECETFAASTDWYIKVPALP